MGLLKDYDSVRPSDFPSLVDSDTEPESDVVMFGITDDKRELY